MKKSYIFLVLIICLVLCSTFFTPQNATLYETSFTYIKPPIDTILDDSAIPESLSYDYDKCYETTEYDYNEHNNENNGDITESSGDENSLTKANSTNIEIEIYDIISNGAIVMTLGGRVLFEKNPDMQMRPASIGKMMVVYTVYHYISNNPEKSLSDMITIRDEDAQVVNTNNGRFHYGNGIYAKERAQSNARLLAGDKLSVDDLLTLVIMPSAGDACLALANYVSGSNKAFLDYMETVAREQIGIDMRLNSVHGGTLSANANSPNGGRFTPRSAALLAGALLRDYGSQVLAKTELMTFSVTVRERTLEFNCSNPLRYEADGHPAIYGVTGMKAGRLGTMPDGVTRDPSISDSNAFANYILTATRNGETIIVVVMEHPWISNWTGENHGLRQDLETLVEYGFYQLDSTLDVDE